MRKKVLSAILAVVMCFTLLSQAMARPKVNEDSKMAPVATEVPEVSESISAASGDVVIAVNTNFDTEEDAYYMTSGGFSSENGAKESYLASAESAPTGKMTGISGYRIDEDGEVLYLRDKVFPAPPTPISQDRSKDAQQKSNEDEPASYSIGDTKTILETDSDHGDVTRTMECLYIGEHCTVWCDIATDPEAVRLTAAYAKEIGDAFDQYQPQVIEAFGDWYDRDGDGKLALFCYDIDQEYKYEVWRGYTAGFFYAADMCDERGAPNDIWTYGSDYSTHIKADCIHLDTYPGMSYENRPFANVENIFSTLVHEFQHLINFSYIGMGKYYTPMETFLNEGFSMAAEHMICGSDSTYNRISYFNSSSSYTCGWPLTYWAQELDNYSNSYLFGQYVRTRYAQQTGTNGNTIFKETLEARDRNKGGNTLEMLADVLNTTPKDLVLDFWTAVYKKDATGNYGFAGEDWADYIRPIFSSTSSKSEIYNGGAKFYNGPLTVNSKNNVEIVTIRSDGTVIKGEVPSASNVQAKRTGVNAATLKLTPTASGTVRYAISDTAITDLADLTSSKTTTANSAVTINLTVPGDGKSGTKVYYALVNSENVASEIFSADIPAWLYPVTIQSPTNGTLKVTSGGSVVNSGDYLALGATCTITATPDEGYGLKELRLDNVVTTKTQFEVSKAHTVAATFEKVCKITVASNSTSYVTAPATAAPNTEISITVKHQGANLLYVNDVLIDKRMGTTSSYTVKYTVTEDCTIRLDTTTYTALGTSGNLDWTLTNGGELTISGKGEMSKYSNKTNGQAPWVSNASSIQKVTIESGVTSVGEYAFYNCTELTSLVLPSSVTTVGKNAFNGCTAQVKDVFFVDATGKWTKPTINNNNTWLTSAAWHNIKSLDDIATLSKGACANGTMTLSPTVVVKDDEVTVTVTPAAGYYVSKITVTGDHVPGGTYTLTGNTYTLPAGGNYTFSAELMKLIDLNGDGKMDNADLTVLAKHVAKIERITNATLLSAADISGDGSVTAADITLLAQRIAEQ